jgi:hypothetical protein
MVIEDLGNKYKNTKEIKMAVAEYMLHNREGDNRRWVPGFIGDRGHWYNPANHTYIGWIADQRDFYVPDSINIITKSDFVTRTLNMHSASPMKHMVVSDDGTESEVAMTNEEVTSLAESWFDQFVAKNQAENP